MTVIAVANQKGGVGKTTTVVNLGAALQERGRRVLILDFDPQASATIHLGIREPDTLSANCGDALQAVASGTGHPTLPEVLIKTNSGLDLIPSGRSLAVAESLLHTVLGRDFVLRDCLEPLRNQYDYILIDCLPTTNILVINALTAADALLIPVQADFLATQGLAQILQTASLIRGRLNTHLEILGILITMVDSRTIHAQRVIHTVRNAFEGKLRIFDTMIRLNVALKESSRAGTTMLHYDPKSPSAAVYRSLAEEVDAAVEQMGLDLEVKPTKSGSKSVLEEAALVALAHAAELDKQAKQDGGGSDTESAEVANAIAAAAARSAQNAQVNNLVLNACPLLGLAEDRTKWLGQASESHRCYGAAVPIAIDPSSQRAVCLHSWHQSCPRYIQRQLAAQKQAESGSSGSPGGGRGISLERLRSLFRSSSGPNRN